MPLDGVVTSNIVWELNDKLAEGKIEKVHQPEKDEIILAVRARGKNSKLLISVNSGFPRINLFEGTRVNPPTPPNFCMLLRKYLQGGRIVSVTQTGLERIVNIRLSLKSELGEPLDWSLIVEIMGKHSNIILIDNENDKVIDSIKKISFDQSRSRQILPGKIYVLPPGQDKISPIGISKDKFSAKLQERNSEIIKSLFMSFQGFSPFIAREICTLSDIDERMLFENLNDEEVSKLYDSFSKIISRITGKDYSPSIFFDADDNVKDFYAFTPEYIKEMYTFKNIESISETIEEFYSSRDNQTRLSQKSADLQKFINARISKLNLKKQKLLEDLIQAEAADKYRVYGELLNANLYKIVPKSDNVQVDNYYDDNKIITIPLSIRLTPSQNAQRYFKIYSKAKTALIQKKVQLEETESELDYFNSVFASVDNIGTVDDIEEIRNELIEEGYMRKRVIKVKKRKPKAVFLSYESSDGLTIYVGKNNLQNDELTTKIASKKDLWFHTKEIHGSHVIVFSNGNEVPENTIVEAARLAAYYSKAKMSENVPVDYTIVKNVKKPNGSKPGMVIYDFYNTIYVNPSESFAVVNTDK